MREATDGIIRVILSHGDTAALEVVDLNGLGLATSRGEDKLELTGIGDDTVLSTVLVTEGMATDDDRLGPARDKTRDLRDKDGLTEDGSSTGLVSDVLDRRRLRLTGCF